MCLVRCSPRHTYLVDLEKGLALAVHDPHDGDVVAEPACVVREDGHAGALERNDRDVGQRVENVAEEDDLVVVAEYELVLALNERDDIDVARAGVQVPEVEVFARIQRAHLDKGLSNTTLARVIIHSNTSGGSPCVRLCSRGAGRPSRRS